MTNRKISSETSAAPACQTFHKKIIQPESWISPNANKGTTLYNTQTCGSIVFVPSGNYPEPEIDSAAHDPLFHAEHVDVKPGLGSPLFANKEKIWCCDTCNMEFLNYVSLACHIAGNKCYELQQKTLTRISIGKSGQYLPVESSLKHMNGIPSISPQLSTTNSSPSLPIPNPGNSGKQSGWIKPLAVKRIGDVSVQPSTSKKSPTLPIQYDENNGNQSYWIKPSAIKRVGNFSAQPPVTKNNANMPIQSRGDNGVQKLSVDCRPKNVQNWKVYPAAAKNSRQNLTVQQPFTKQGNLSLPFDTRAKNQRSASSVLISPPGSNGARNVLFVSPPPKKDAQNSPAQKGASENSLFKFCMGFNFGRGNGNDTK